MSDPNTHDNTCRAAAEFACLLGGPEHEQAAESGSHSLNLPASEFPGFGRLLSYKGVPPNPEILF